MSAFPHHMYGLQNGQVSVCWTNEPTVEDIDTLIAYLQLHRRVVEKRPAKESDDRSADK